MFFDNFFIYQGTNTNLLIYQELKKVSRTKNEIIILLETQCIKKLLGIKTQI